MGELQRLALHIGADERTLRRAVSAGTVRCQRPTPRRLKIATDEQDYLHSRWSVLATLRRVLRTEPNVRLAVLYGSVARGEEGESSDLDLMVDFARRDPRTRHRLIAKLEGKLGREVQLVHLADAKNSPMLLSEVLAEGRVIVDRDHVWPRLLRRRHHVEREARQHLDEQLAAVRASAEERR